MKILEYVCAIILSVMANAVSASWFNIQLRDFALPGIASDFQVRGWCDSSNSYENLPSCDYSVPSWNAVAVTSNDKELVLKIHNVEVKANTIGYDQYVVFREKGANPTIDDVMRVQFSVLDEFDEQANLPGLAEITVSLISGGLVPGYIAGLPTTANKIGDFTNDVNQEFFVFSPFQGVDGGFPTEFSVIPTFLPVPEPSSLLLLSLGLPFLVRRRPTATH